ncbi:MAG: glycerate kinase [Cyclobacteriaceae bacterium]
MKVLISPDKFKGSLTADEVCNAVESALLDYDQTIEVIKHPLADGGEGTLDILDSTLDLKTVSVQVNDPLFRPITAEYKMDESSAYIEMAAASGLPILKEEERNCLITTTYGTGELILDAIEEGATNIYLFVGGSATNDAGMGMAEALGYKLYDKDGKALRPIGLELSNLAAIDSSDLKYDPDEVNVFVVCDVKNPLYGENGAAYIYGPQKGADQSAIELLDGGLRNFAKIAKSSFDKDVSKMEGAGAAGGIGGGAAVFLNAEIKPGIQTILEITNYTSKLTGVDLIITGEGKLDIQTVHGKVIHGVDQVSRESGIPYSIICGIAEDLDVIHEEIAATEILQIKTDEVSLDSAINDAASHVHRLASGLIERFMKAG